MKEAEFLGQRKGEKVQLVFRRHGLVMRRGWGFFAMVTLFGTIPLRLWPDDGRMWWVFLGFLTVGALGWLYVYMLWYFSFFIVTNERLRQVTQKGLFKKIVLDLEKEKVQSVAFLVPGMMAGVLNYGTLVIKTEIGDMTISQVKNVEKVYNIVQNALRVGEGVNEGDL